MAFDSACSKRLPSLKFVGDTFSVSALIVLVTLTFNFLTSHLVRVILPVGWASWATFLPILMFLGLFVLDLWANTCQAHHVTLRP